MKRSFIAKKYDRPLGTPYSNTTDMSARFDDCINLSLGDPDIITNKIIIDAAYKDALAGHTKYTDGRGQRELREEICKFYKEEYNMDIADEEVMVTTSGLLGLFLTLQAVIDPGDEVILQAPYFWPYSSQVEMAGGVPVEMSTYEEEDFQINLERFEALITDKTKAIIINSPSNPTGSCLSVETMEAMAKIVEKYDLLVIADDTYNIYSFERDFVPFASLPGMKERTIIVNSFSKSFLMTGWRIGNVIATPEIISVVKEVNENVAFSAPTLSQRGVLCGLRRRKEIQQPIIEEYRKRMFYAAERVNQVPWMKVIYPPKGSFYLFINIKATGLTSMEAADMILEKAHVLVLPGSAFGQCGEGYVRAACTVGVDKLKEAFDRIEKIEMPVK